MKRSRFTEQQIAELEKKHIALAARGGLVRIAPHFYNTTEEADKVLDSLPRT